MALRRPVPGWRRPGPCHHRRAPDSRGRAERSTTAARARALSGGSAPSGARHPGRDVSERVADYRFAESVRLRISGPERALRHFDAEYGEVPVPPGSAGEPDVEVRIGFGLRAQPIAGGATVTGGHKTARWTVGLGRPDAHPLRASIVLAGGPPSFALSLVQ